MKRAFLRGKIKTFTTGLRLLVINPFRRMRATFP